MQEGRTNPNQVVVVHLSDIHFGRDHRFNPVISPTGDRPSDSAYPTFLEKLVQDLDGDDPGCPVVFCVTGDLVETGSLEEFGEAEEFLRGLADSRILGKTRGIGSIFVVPGNHDVQFDHDDLGARWQQWAEFYNRLYGKRVKRDEPLEFVDVHDRSTDLDCVIACLNSTIYVQKDKPDEDRGRLNVDQLDKIEQQLEHLDRAKLQRSIKIALIHHHPVLLPALAEPGRGYDAVHNSGSLLNILRRYGFHLILHGHKHNPHTFTDDTRSAFQKDERHPILIAAGGSAGSFKLPPAMSSFNTYNRITVKWDSDADQTRILVETRGLETYNDDGTERLPTRWSWRTLRVDDRHFVGPEHTPKPSVGSEREFAKDLDSDDDDRRTRVYQETRGNLPVVQIRPSFLADQSYEAVLWIVYHEPPDPAVERDLPTEVTWSAGPRFEVVTVGRDADPTFCASLAYWGPMLVQAKLRFADGHTAYAQVYADMPSTYQVS